MSLFFTIFDEGGATYGLAALSPFLLFLTMKPESIHF